MALGPSRVGYWRKGLHSLSPDGISIGAEIQSPHSVHVSTFTIENGRIRFSDTLARVAIVSKSCLDSDGHNFGGTHGHGNSRLSTHCDLFDEALLAVVNSGATDLSAGSIQVERTIREVEAY